MLISVCAQKENVDLIVKNAKIYTVDDDMPNAEAMAIRRVDGHALLDQYGKIALGTDFPVEKVNPMLIFYAAVARKDLNNYPENGFQLKNGLSREKTLKGMTIWAAYSNFKEDEKGNIKKGKYADFIILDQNIMEIPLAEILKTKVISTYVNGEKVY